MPIPHLSGQNHRVPLDAENRITQRLGENQLPVNKYQASFHGRIKNGWIQENSFTRKCGQSLPDIYTFPPPIRLILKARPQLGGHHPGKTKTGERQDEKDHNPDPIPLSLPGWRMLPGHDARSNGSIDENTFPSVLPWDFFWVETSFGLIPAHPLFRD
jgi:hypothetical protein